MEIESENGSKIILLKGEGSGDLEFGRNSGFNSTDLTVSRRHIRFEFHKDQTRVCFEVIGKNPIWVRDNRSDEIRVYRRSERGEMECGDSFCVSLKNPVWFKLNRVECNDEAMNEVKEELRFDEEFAEGSVIEDMEIESGDFSHRDPVKEFDFVVMGHEFDCYPKKLIRDMKDWDWFIEEPGEESEDDEANGRKRKKGGRRKRRKGGGDEDDDVWTGESEEDTEVIHKIRNVQKPRYSTRSKDRDKSKKGVGAGKNTWQKDATRRTARNNEDKDEDDDDDDEDDDTLGGFIVDDENIDEEEGTGEDDEEEEEEDEEEFEEDEE